MISMEDLIVMLDDLQKDGLVLNDNVMDPADFKGTDWKNVSTAKWFQLAKANKSFMEPGISWHELAALHYACELLKDRPLTVLETGQCYGTTTRYFVVRNIKYGGELHSIEYIVRPKFDEAMKDLGLDVFIDTIRGHSQKIFWDKPIGILFIDSEHALSDALGEYMKYRLFLDFNSIVGFHDVENCYGVRRAIEVAQEIDDLELVASVPQAYGAGIKMFQLKNLNGAQVKINHAIQAKELEALLESRRKEAEQAEGKV